MIIMKIMKTTIIMFNMTMAVMIVMTIQVELLLENKVETKDALLHAINEEYVEAVEVLLSLPISL